MRYLLTDGNYKHTLAAGRALARAGHSVATLGHRYCVSRFSRYIARVHDQSIIERNNPEALLTLLGHNKYDVLMPVGARSCRWVAQHQTQLAPFIGVASPSPDRVALAMDKEQLQAFAAGLGIDVPATWHFDRIRDLEDAAADLPYPVVLKTRYEGDEGGPFYARDAKDLLQLLTTSAFRRHVAAVGMPLVQQRIVGPGKGFFAIYDHGTLKQGFMHQRLREYPNSGGASVCAESIYERELAETGQRLLDQLQWHGVAMVEFKHQLPTRRGDKARYVLMELNPKWWGSLELAIASGVPFPELYGQLAMGQLMPAAMPYRVGVTFHWPLNGEWRHVMRDFSSAKQVLADTLSPKVKSNVDWTDPLPIVHALVNECRLIIRDNGQQSSIVTQLSRLRNIGPYFAIVRWLSEERGVLIARHSKLARQLFLGPQPSAKSYRTLHSKWGITRVIDLRHPDETHTSQAQQMPLPVTAVPMREFQAIAVSDIQAAVAAALSEIAVGGRVYIHCREGIGRAATVAIACLIAQGMTPPEAEAAVRQIRPFIAVNQLQRSSLESWVQEHGDANRARTR